MHPGAIAAVDPNGAAVITSGQTLTFAELDERSARLANLFRSRGLSRGETVAFIVENHPRFLELTWAAQRSGLFYTAVNSHLTPAEAGYILSDCGATLLVTTTAMVPMVRAMDPADLAKVTSRLLIGDEKPGFESYEQALESMLTSAVSDEVEGDFMLYSSGTTGRPKGVRRPLSYAPMGQGPGGPVPMLQSMGMGAGDIYLCPAPLYHAAPMAWSMAAHRLGATVVVMERFDPEECLSLIEKFAVTHAQFVPTMFIRMLKLPAKVRARYDTSSLRGVVHAAAPCPVDVKRAMIEWWGPIISEFYSATEGLGGTWITSEEWLAHPGSVGRAAMGEAHILDESGDPLPTGEVGAIWFSGGSAFEYHNDPQKTADAHNDSGWSTVGDVGYLNENGYLYLTDRKSFMIISGGVNIYPQEIENVLLSHPAVMDAGVIGLPHEEMGQEVMAVVQPLDFDDADRMLADELLAYCRAHLAGYKCPRSLVFESQLPRSESGKLYKRTLVDCFRQPDSSELLDAADGQGTSMRTRRYRAMTAAERSGVRDDAERRHQ